MNAAEKGSSGSAIGAYAKRWVKRQGARSIDQAPGTERLIMMTSRLVQNLHVILTRLCNGQRKVGLEKKKMLTGASEGISPREFPHTSKKLDETAAEDSHADDNIRGVNSPRLGVK